MLVSTELGLARVTEGAAEGAAGEALLAREPWSKSTDARPYLGVAGGDLLTPGTFAAQTGADGAEAV